MAYEDDYEGATSQTNYGLAQNPLMPMGDPLAYARAGPNPETAVPAIQTQGMRPPQIMQPQPLNVPPPAHRGGGDGSTNQLQPQEQQQGLDQNQLGSLGQLLQMKGLTDLVAPTAADVTYTPGGAVARPGAGAGPGRVPTGAMIEKAAAPYKDMINDAAKQNNVDPQTLTRLLYRESQFDPNAKSPAGAQGIGQFMPATAKDEGVDVKDPKSSIYGSARYFAKMTKMFNNNEQLGMAAYNWGPGNLQQWLKGGMRGYVPKETLDYVNAISGRPLAPNMPTKTADIPAVGVTPQEEMTTSKGGGFKVPPAASAIGTTEMSPSGGPYVVIAGKKYATDASGNVVNPNSKMKYPDRFDPNNTEDKPAVSASVSKPGLGPDQGTPNLGGGVSQPMRDPNKIVPGATPAPVAPEQNQGQNQQPGMVPTATSGSFNDETMKKLWQYMLIKSLFPPIQFRNVGYDPWAVHRFGQGGGY